jgi:signal transduction histidine kinase
MNEGTRSPLAIGRGTRMSWITAGAAATARGLALCGLMPAGAVLVAGLAAPLALLGLGLGFLLNPPPWMAPGVRLVPFAGLCAGLVLLPFLLRAARWVTGSVRRLAGLWCDVPIPAPYRRPPQASGRPARFVGRSWWLVSDPASWRDVAWLTVNVCVGWLLAAAPASLVAVGLAGFAGPSAGLAIPPPAFPGNSRPLLAVLGLAITALGLAVAPWLLRAYGLAARSLLGPTGRAEMAWRVSHLAQTRSEAIDAGAAELRRIERDLHDGAQARLVAMGMALDAAGHLIADDPDAARALLYEARDSSARALAELRNLVRGIHPAVLADRGLTDAVRALALDSPLAAELAGELPGRLPAAVESAAYFAVSELLANAAKHARATRVWIDMRHSGDTLRIGITDNGHGGADPARGTGLHGIERRLAAFDGVLALTSPAGGPTAATMEIPCALSSPKTSSSSARA